jgi:hypothetical protein
MYTRGFGRIKLLILTILTVVLCGGGKVIYDHFLVNGLRAEARIMLSYVHTLETAYHIESSRFVGFSTPYGASEGEVDNCTQPSGAAELGFILKDCQKSPLARTIRYFYQVEVAQDEVGFTGRASSGVGLDGQSLVCLGTTKKDIFSINQERVIKHIQPCQ